MSEGRIRIKNKKDKKEEGKEGGKKYKVPCNNAENAQDIGTSTLPRT
jgi:hypothetical protein